MTAKVLITGAGGMLGQALVGTAPEHVAVLACTRQQLDITNAQAVEQAVLEFQPHAIINAAAYTQVDRAEQEPEQAYAVNRDGALNVAQTAARLAIPLLHISTDYVFDGVFPDGVCRPYREDDTPNPLNVYGVSKLAGEQAIQATHEKAIIVRSSTLFSNHTLSGYTPLGDGAGKRDFVSWVLNQARQNKKFKVIDSWVSCPTPVESLAHVLWQLAEFSLQGDTCVFGLWHYAGTPAVSRYTWAREIIKTAQQAGLVGHDVEVCPCLPEDVKTIAKRPLYSALDGERIKNLGFELAEW